MAETCFVCNKKIGHFFGHPYAVEIGSGTKDIHYECRHKYSLTPEKYGGPSDKKLERRTTEREHKVASHAPNEAIEVNHDAVCGTEPSTIELLSVLGWLLFAMMGLSGLFLIFQDGGGIFGVSLIIAGVFQLSIFLGFSAIIDQLYKINVNTSSSDKHKDN